MSPAKVYIIDAPSQIASRDPQKKGEVGRRPGRASRRETDASFRTTKHGWLLALRAYALGPVHLVLWPRGKGRIAWAIVGAVSFVAATLLWLTWSAFLDVLGRFEYGAVLWAASVATVILLAAAAWAHAVATSENRARWPGFLRRPVAVCALGLVLPGLGLLIAGRRWRAAVAVWCTGLLTAAIVIAKHWRWLMANDLNGQSGPTPQTIEGILSVAAACVALGFLAWLVFVLDGVRAASPAARSSSLANGLALTLIVTLVSFFAAFRPISVARDLDSTAGRLRHEGLRMVPLALYEIASTLDPGTPTYVAEAAKLYDELGLSNTAETKRDLLERRATQFAGAVGAELVPIAAPEDTL